MIFFRDVPTPVARPLRSRDHFNQANSHSIHQPNPVSRNRILRHPSFRKTKQTRIARLRSGDCQEARIQNLTVDWLLETAKQTNQTG